MCAAAGRGLPGRPNRVKGYAAAARALRRRLDGLGARHDLLTHRASPTLTAHADFAADELGSTETLSNLLFVHATSPRCCCLDGPARQAVAISPRGSW